MTAKGSRKLSKRAPSLAAMALALWARAVCSAFTPLTATTYVGPQFEIRDHDQPIKYVFNGANRVAEITGSISSKQRIQRLRVYPGWNLCALAVNGALATGGGEAVTNVVSAMFEWEADQSGWVEVGVGQRLLAGTVIWIEAKAGGVLSILGQYTDPSSQLLSTGGHYLPCAGLEDWLPVLPGLPFAWFYDARIGRWFEDLPGALAAASDTFITLAPGQACYIETDTPTALDAPAPTGRVRYYHQDQLGSSTVITDGAGAGVEEEAYFPFGATRHDAGGMESREPFQFTQKERDRESGLNYFEARYLADSPSRFLSVDPKFATLDLLQPGDMALYEANPQKMNSYSYVQNNPMASIDPDGLDTWGAQVRGELSMGADASVGVGVVSYGEHWYSHLNPLNFGVCGSFAVGVGTPGASVGVELSHNSGGRADYEGRSSSYGWSAGEGVVVSGSYSSGSGKPSGSVGVNLGIGPTPVGGSYQKASTKCVTGEDVVMGVGETLWSVVPRRFRPWTKYEDQARAAELRTQQLNAEADAMLADVDRRLAAIDQQLRINDEKLKQAQQLLDQKEREAHQQPGQ